VRPQWQCAEVEALCAAWPLLRDELASVRAQAYLDERAIPPDIAQAAGIGYLSRAAAEEAPVPDEQRDLLSRWIGRIVFPLGSPDGRGFIGRSLWYWEPGMDELQHKAVLETAGMRRWIKTNPAGWFGPHPSHYTPTLVLVEGGFDRLALMAAGIGGDAIVALVGTAARAEWIIRFAPQVQRVVLALDGDEGGTAAMERLAHEFQQAGLAAVDLCPPPVDECGKDWSERWRRYGQAGCWPLIETI
jgi:DNA primase